VDFTPVHCPVCDSIVMEIATGLSRGKCPNRQCKRRVWAMSDGHEVRIGMVDAPKLRLVR